MGRSTFWRKTTVAFTKRQKIIGACAAAAVLLVGGVATATLVNTPSEVVEIAAPDKTDKPDGTKTNKPNKPGPSPTTPTIPVLPDRDSDTDGDSRDSFWNIRDSDGRSVPREIAPADPAPKPPITPVVSPSTPPTPTDPGDGGGDGNTGGGNENPGDGGGGDPGDGGGDGDGGGNENPNPDPTDPTDPVDPEPTQQEIADAAYTEANGVNHYGNAEFTCNVVSTGTGISEVAGAPVLDAGRVLGWVVVADGTTWNVIWYSCAPVTDPTDPTDPVDPNDPDPVSATNVASFIERYNELRVSEGNEALPVERFQVPKADASICWNAKNKTNIDYVFDHAGDIDPSNPNPHANPCGGSEASYQAWGFDQHESSPFISTGASAANGWFGSPGHKGMIFDSAQSNNPEVCMTISFGFKQVNLGNNRIDWAFSSIATWQACDFEGTVPALEADPSLASYTPPVVTEEAAAPAKVEDLVPAS